MNLCLLLFVILTTPYSLFSEGFLAGTLVKTPNGYESIEKINPGDFVISFNGMQNAAPCKVNAVCWEDVKQLVKFKINEEILFVGLNHKFYSKEASVWIYAKDITINSKLLQIIPLKSNDDESCTVKIEEVEVQAVEIINQESRIYCMDVQNYPNFCVSKSHLVVHNAWIVGILDFLCSAVTCINGIINKPGVESLINNSTISNNKVVNLITGSNNITNVTDLNTPLAVAVVGGVILLIAILHNKPSVKSEDNNNPSNPPDSPETRSLPGFKEDTSPSLGKNSFLSGDFDENKTWRDEERNILQCQRANENQCAKINCYNADPNKNKCAEIMFAEGPKDNFMYIKITDQDLIKKMRDKEEKKKNSASGFFYDIGEGFRELTMPLRKIFNHDVAAPFIAGGLVATGNPATAAAYFGKRAYQIYSKTQVASLPINTPPPYEYGRYEEIGKNTGTFVDDKGRFWVRHKNSYGTWSAFDNSGKRVMLVDNNRNCKKFN